MALAHVPVRAVRVDADPRRVLVHPLRRHPGLGVVVGVDAPCPLHRAGSEDEGAARVAVEREVVGGGAGVEHRAAVLHVRHVVDGGLGEAKEAWRTEPVVEVLVPLVSEQPLEEHRALARLEPRDVGVAPETKPRVLGRDDDRIVAPGIHGEDGSRERVLRLRPLGVEGARVPPGAVHTSGIGSILALARVSL